MKKYNVIYADPPWHYRDKQASGERGAEYKYKTMKDKEIAALPMGNIAADDCAYFQWATGPKMPECIELLKGFGFRYVNICMTWIKYNKNWSLATGMGNYTRANAEYLLLGLKGRPQRVSKSVHSVVIAKRGQHSAKPPEVMDRIVELFGDVPRAELFARDEDRGGQTVEGWDQTGLEFDGILIQDFLTK